MIHGVEIKQVDGSYRGTLYWWGEKHDLGFSQSLAKLYMDAAHQEIYLKATTRT